MLREAVELLDVVKKESGCSFCCDCCVKYTLFVTNFIRPYLHLFSIDSHGLNGYGKPLKRPFDRYQSRLKAISNGRDIRQINW